MHDGSCSTLSCPDLPAESRDRAATPPPRKHPTVTAADTGSDTTASDELDSLGGLNSPGAPDAPDSSGPPPSEEICNACGHPRPIDDFKVVVVSGKRYVFRRCLRCRREEARLKRRHDRAQKRLRDAGKSLTEINRAFRLANDQRKAFALLTALIDRFGGVSRFSRKCVEWANDPGVPPSYRARIIGTTLHLFDVWGQELAQLERQKLEARETVYGLMDCDQLAAEAERRTIERLRARGWTVEPPAGSVDKTSAEALAG